MGAREGDGVGDEPESDSSSGGGVGGAARVLAGTDLDRNLGTGSADGAGEAWNVGPAYAPWTLAGVPAVAGPSSVSVKEEVAMPLGEKTRSAEGCEKVCFLGLRGPVGMATSSLECTALSVKGGSSALVTGGVWAPAPLF
jgi:hypothetical protein